MTLTHRYKAWLMLETATPLSVGSGREGITTDRLVAANAAGYPYIPGTGLAGPLRHALSAKLQSETTDDGVPKIDDLFGYARGNDIQGSRLIVNSAHLLAADGSTVLEGLAAVDERHPYYTHFQSLPERDHVRIDHRGVAEDGRKFDEQVLFKGVRMVASIELIGSAPDAALWKQIIDQFSDPAFRIGGGTRKGFGKLSIVKTATQIYDLSNNNDLDRYLEHDNSLTLPKGVSWAKPTNGQPIATGFETFHLSINAKDVFLFGAGFGDSEADAVYKTEQFFEWSSDKDPKLVAAHPLLPASSVKGALRHRVSYHYNKTQKLFADQSEAEIKNNLEQKLHAAISEKVNIPDGLKSDDPLWETTIKALENLQYAEVNPQQTKGKPVRENEAVETLFGFPNDTDDQGQRGHVIINDVYLPLQSTTEKVFDHVRIDRYTGGASDGALFQEKTIGHGAEIKMDILVHHTALLDPVIKQAWLDALTDLCEGRLPLGGRTNSGHGTFTGSYSHTPLPA